MNMQFSKLNPKCDDLDEKLRWMKGPQQHILGFVINLYNYIFIKKDICD
jgi:hypothetical protein